MSQSASHTWKQCMPLKDSDPDSPDNRKIKKIMRGMPESDRIKMHRATCQKDFSSVNMAAVDRFRQQLAAAGVIEDDQKKMTAACINVDIAKVVPSNALGPGVQSPVSIDHVLSNCDRCQDDVWIGPKQLKLAQAGTAERVCYKCILRDPVLRDLMGQGHFVGLDANADQRPRRF